MELWAAYDSNEVAADERYKGKLLRVVGTLASIDKDFLDKVVLRLRSPNQFMHTSATLVDAQKGAAASLRKGMEITVECECAGRIVGSPVLRKCEIR
jgi:hypothetical protein